jgi:hypothetical protein
LVGFWTFNAPDIYGATSTDVSGNGNNGLITGAAVTPGKVGQALNFKGINTNYVTLNSSPISNFANPNSICAWALTTDNTIWDGTYDQTIGNFFTDSNNWVRFGNDSGNNGYGYPPGSFFVNYWSGGIAYRFVYLGELFKNNTWVHACYVWNGSTISLYGNGAELATSTAGSYSADTSTGNRIGVRSPGTWGTWKGKLDEVRVYNKALSAAEVRRLYNLGK